MAPSEGSGGGDPQLPAPLDVVAFHDESGDFGHGEWAFIGLLWVPRADVPALAAGLAAARGEWRGEVHFHRFPRNFGGDFGAAARTAQAWFEAWRSAWSGRVWLDVLAVNRRHPRYDRARLARPEVAYDHFSALAVRVGLASFFAGRERVRLAIYSDERSGSPGVGAPGGPDGLATDVRRALEEARGEGGPAVDPPDVPIVRLDGAPGEGPLAAERELLQLTDLLLGAVATAVDPRTVAATKRWFAREMARLVQDARRTAGPRPAVPRGHLLVRYFPDPDGRLYADGPLAVLET